MLRYQSLAFRLAIKCNIRSITTLPSYISAEKTSERGILSLVHQKEFDKAIAEFKVLEEKTLKPSYQKLTYFRVKLVSHLIANGLDDCLNLLDNPEINDVLTDEQFAAALERILGSETAQNPIRSAVKFYRKIVENGYHRKRNRDTFIRQIVLKAVKFPASSFESIWQLYLKLAAIEPQHLTIKEEQIRQKLHSATLWEIIKFTNLLPENKKYKQKAMERLKDFIDANASHLQAGCLNGLWLLYENRIIEFIDALLVTGQDFTPNHVEYLMIVALSTKEPKLLIGFLDYPQLFKKVELFVSVCEKLALIYGKNNDFEGLEALYKKIIKIYKKSPAEYHISSFYKALLRICHFYKCSNIHIPDDLDDVLIKVR